MKENALKILKSVTVLLAIMAISLPFVDGPYPWQSIIWVAGIVLLLPIFKILFVAKNFLAWNVLEYVVLSCLMFFAPAGFVVTPVWLVVTIVYVACGMKAVTEKSHKEEVQINDDIEAQKE